MTIFDWHFALRILPALFQALGTTVEITLLGMALALILGLLFAIARRSAIMLIARPMAIVVEFLRRTPLLVQIYFLFYVIPKTGIELSALTTGIIALALHYGAYCSEVYRAGIEAVPVNQWDAAAALNFSRFRTWITVILPQAILPELPVLGNYLISMFKDTPMLSVITVMELLQESKIIGAQSFRYTEPLTLVGILFLIVSLISASGIHFLEHRLRISGDRDGINDTYAARA